MAARRRAVMLIAAATISIGVSGCKPEPALVAGSVDSHEFTARVRRAIPAGESDAAGEQTLASQGFDCARTDTLQSEEEDTLQSHSSPDEPGTEYLTCDYVRGRRWGEKTRRRYLVVLYIRGHRIDHIFGVTHLREVH